MENKTEIISEFEELLKLKEFKENNQKEPYLYTYEEIRKSIEIEYNEKIEEKIQRWLNATHLLYFRNVLPVFYYLQAKMLYRDGFYESSITMVRSICEMICYDLLKTTIHPFGNIDEIETENFRTLLKFLAIPKTIDKNKFENLIYKISDSNAKNYIRSSYTYDNSKKSYKFKTENGKTPKNLNRFFVLFDNIDFKDKDNFPENSYKLLNEIYDTGNLYVHAHTNNNEPKDDALKNLDKMCEVLSTVYKIDNTSLQRKTIISGYNKFPDICIGNNFAIEYYPTPEDAQRGYYNLPTKRNMDNLLSIEGVWNGEWLSENKRVFGTLKFTIKGGYFYANLFYIRDKKSVNEPMDIKIFGDYFRIKGFDETDLLHNEEKHAHFELEKFNENFLIGKNMLNGSKVLFKKEI